MTARVPSVSFEFFPPKSDKTQASLWETIRRLAPLGPAFVSVTYGAGGSTRERTHATVTNIQAEAGIPAAAHLTCVAAQCMELGAMTAFLYLVTVRDSMYEHLAALTGARVTYSYGRIGGLAFDVPAGWFTRLEQILKEKGAGWTIITFWDKGEQKDMKFMLISGAVVNCINCKDTGVIESRYSEQRQCWCEKGKQIRETL